MGYLPGSGSDEIDVKIKENTDPGVCESIGGKPVEGKDGSNVCVIVQDKDKRPLEHVSVENITPEKVELKTPDGQRVERERE